MKIIYILKKGFQYYPPCLSQILYLNDLGIDVEIWHGKNSDFINNLLEDRNIVHYTFQKDRLSKNKIDRVLNFLSFSREIKSIQKEVEKNAILWIGNLETAMAMNDDLLSKHTFVLNVLELYDEGTMYDRYLKKMAAKARVLICCERHRGAIMQSRYKLESIPVVIPNKPYDLSFSSTLSRDIAEKLSLVKDKFIVLYQGIITPDRPLEKIALALRKMNDTHIVFAFMGKCNNRKYPQYLKEIYPESYYLGYIPAPEHLEITKLCDVGIANYDYSNLNNVFCAPNKIYEYAKYGKPILGSMNIGLTETVGKYGAAECVNFGNIDEIIRGLVRIKNNYTDYAEAANNFYKDVDGIKLIQSVLNQLK